MRKKRDPEDRDMHLWNGYEKTGTITKRINIFRDPKDWAMHSLNENRIENYYNVKRWIYIEIRRIEPCIYRIKAEDYHHYKGWKNSEIQRIELCIYGMDTE